MTKLREPSSIVEMAEMCRRAQDAYVAERRAAGRKPFLDGPHFELPATVYPVG